MSFEMDNASSKFEKELAEKTKITIKYIKLYGTKVITDNGYRFEDGKSIVTFYRYMRREYNRVIRKKNMKPFESYEKELYERIEKALVNSNNLTKEEMLVRKESEELAKEKEIDLFLEKVDSVKGTIKRIKKLPAYLNNETKDEYYLDDGTSKRKFYFRLRKECTDIENKVEIDRFDKVKLKAYKELSNLLKEIHENKKEEKEIVKNKKSNEFISRIETKTDELIKIIEKYGFIPVKENNPNLPFMFEDGVKYITFYAYLQSRYSHLILKNDLNETEVCEKKSFELINEAYKNGTKDKIILNDTFGIVDKTVEFIDTMLKIERLPIKKEKNNDISEYTFNDGVDMRDFYDKLKSSYFNAKNRKYEAANDHLVVSCYENILWYIGFLHLKKYYESHGDLNIIDGYIAKIDGNKTDLRRWLDKQIRDYSLIDKSDIQLEHERMLDGLCPEWYLIKKFNISQLLKKQF